MRFVRTICAAALVAASASAASAETYLCTVKAQYGRITLAPEIAIQVFEDRGSARVLDGVVHKVQEYGALANVEKRPALTEVSWRVKLRTGNNPQRTREFTYKAAIWPDGRAVVHATLEKSNKYKRTTGHCKISNQSMDEIGSFGTRLDKPLRTH